MKKKSIVLDNNDKKALEWIIYNSSSRAKVKKAEVILLRNKNKTISDIINKTGLSKRTIINYQNNWIKDKLRFIYGSHYKKSNLETYCDKLKIEFNERPPLTYKEATIRIKKLTGLKRSETQVRSFLKKNKIYTKRTRIREHIAFGTLQKIRYRERIYKEDLKKAEIEEEFKKTPPLTYKEASVRLEKVIGLKRSENQVRELLNRYGIYTQGTRARKRFQSEMLVPTFDDTDIIDSIFTNL